MMDLPAPWAVLKEIHDHFAGVAVQICNSGREVVPQLIALHVDDESGCVQSTILPPHFTIKFFESSQTKEALGEFLAAMLTPEHPLQCSLEGMVGFKPNMVVQISESWTGPEDMTPAEIEALQSGRLQVSEMRGRREIIGVFLHMRGTTVPVMSPILEQPARHAKLGQFPPQSSFVAYGGRLAMDERFGSSGPVH